MRPPIRMWTPMTASSSAWLQPSRLVVWPNTRARTASPVSSEMIDWKTWTAKFARYWSSLSAPTRKKTPNSLTARNGSRRGAVTGRATSATSATHGGIAPHGDRPEQSDADDEDRDPQGLHREPAEELGRRQLADQRLNRIAERPLERQHVRDALGPLRHQRQRHEPPGEEQLERHHDLHDRAEPGRPERDEPEVRVHERPDEVGAPDRDAEDRDADRLDVERRPEQQRQQRGDWQPQDDH